MAGGEGLERDGEQKLVMKQLKGSDGEGLSGLSSALQ